MEKWFSKRKSNVDDSFLIYIQNAFQKKDFWGIWTRMFELLGMGFWNLWDANGNDLLKKHYANPPFWRPPIFGRKDHQKFKKSESFKTDPRSGSSAPPSPPPCKTVKNARVLNLQILSSNNKNKNQKDQKKDTKRILWTRIFWTVFEMDDFTSKLTQNKNITFSEKIILQIQ